MMRYRWALVLLLVICAPVFREMARAQADDRLAVEWVRENAIPIKTAEAGNGFEDLQRLNQVVGDARIVELGEATHGTREFFQLKHRLVEYLAAQKGFTIFSIEANMPEAYRLNDYVLRGEGDPRQLLKGMYFWTWDTQEVLAMIEWMRQFNQSGKGHIEFTGFDMQTPTVAMETVRKFLEHHDPAYVSATLDPLYSQIKQGGPGGSSFGVATASFPAGLAAGKRVTLSGFIRSEEIKEGWAGLWLRADGPQHSVVAFKNMESQGVKGTTGWKRYEISIDVPRSAEQIVFGALNTGSGVAWVDSLAITVGGVPFTDESNFDLGFESSTPRGFYTGGQGYEVRIDTAEAQSGKQSLKLARVARSGGQAATAITEAQVKKCAAVVDYLDANRERYLKGGLPASEIDWVVQNARLVWQFAELQTGKQTRDESMAQNVKWIADQNPGAKIVVWAHNGHVSYTGFPGSASMGSSLKKMFGAKLVNFGFAFNEGGFRAVEQGKGLHEFDVAPGATGTLDVTLAKVGIPVFAVDLRRVPASGPVRTWFSETHASRSIGSMYSAESDRQYWSRDQVNEAFDVLLFVEKTTAARGN